MIGVALALTGGMVLGALSWGRGMPVWFGCALGGAWGLGIGATCRLLGLP